MPIIANEPFDVGQRNLGNALLEADALGTEIARGAGDDAYRALHA